MILLSTAFCPPIEYLALMARDMRILDDPQRSVVPSTVLVEACETYQKQSWRNRCRILTADGATDFPFPVTHPAVGESIRSVRVDYSTGWVTRLERTLSAAYDSSPFFAYYADGLFSVLRHRPDHLFDLNMEVLRWLLSCLHINAELRLTESFAPVPETEAGAAMETLPQPSTEAVSADGRVFGIEDFRFLIHPKRANSILSGLGLGKPYWQVFSGRFGFVPGLSALDLLFNLGPDALPHLKKLP